MRRRQRRMDRPVDRDPLHRRSCLDVSDRLEFGPAQGASLASRHPSDPGRSRTADQRRLFARRRIGGRRPDPRCRRHFDLHSAVLCHPSMILSGGAAAVGFAVINSVDNLAGFISPYMLACWAT